MTGSPESEQTHKTKKIKLRMSEGRIFTGDILISLDLGMQAELPSNNNFSGYPYLTQAVQFLKIYPYGSIHLNYPDGQDN